MNRQAVKNLSFGALYGKSSMKSLALPEPSAVERLGALADPVLADRVFAYDHPEKAAERYLRKWAAVLRGKSTTKPGKSTSPSQLLLTVQSPRSSLSNRTTP